MHRRGAWGHLPRTLFFLFPAGLLLAASGQPATAQLSLTWTKAASAFADRVITGVAFLDNTTVVAVGWQPTSGSYSTLLVRRQRREGNVLRVGAVGRPTCAVAVRSRGTAV